LQPIFYGLIIQYLCVTPVTNTNVIYD